jgi:hypothetical protein
MNNEEGLTATVLGSAFRTARIAHVCQCGKAIKKGERYERELWKVEGELDVVKIGSHIHSFEEAEARIGREC